MDSDGWTVVSLVAVFGTVVSRLPAVRPPPSAVCRRCCRCRCCRCCCCCVVWTS